MPYLGPPKVKGDEDLNTDLNFKYMINPVYEKCIYECFKNKYHGHFKKDDCICY